MSYSSCLIVADTSPRAIPRTFRISLFRRHRLSLLPLRGDPFITFAPRGRGGGLKKWPIFANNSTDRLRETANKGGKGVQNPENFAYVLYGCSLIVSSPNEQSMDVIYAHAPLVVDAHLCEDEGEAEQLQHVQC